MNLPKEPFLDNMSSILDVHAALKLINKYKSKIKTKPWITSTMQKFFTFYKKFSKKGLKFQRSIKRSFHRKPKDYRNILLTLFRKSKTNYYHQYFEANMDNTKNAWKRINSFIVYCR